MNRLFLTSPWGRRRRLRRIARYEALLQELQQLLSRPDASKEELLAARKTAAELEQYYGSAVWKRDFAADEAGLLPKELKRGVLSEDGVFNALDAYHDRLGDL